MFDGKNEMECERKKKVYDGNDYKDCKTERKKTIIRYEEIKFAI